MRDLALRIASAGEMTELADTLESTVTNLTDDKGILIEAAEGYCQLFCVKLLFARFLMNGKFGATFAMGFDRQWSSILRQTKASRV